MQSLAVLQISFLHFQGMILSNWTVRGLDILVQVIVFLLLFNFPGLSMNHSRHFGFGITIVNVFLKDVSFGAPFNLHTYNSLLEFFRIISAWIKVLSNVIFSFSCTSSRLISFPDLL